MGTACCSHSETPNAAATELTSRDDAPRAQEPCPTEEVEKLQVPVSCDEAASSQVQALGCLPEEAIHDALPSQACEREPDKACDTELQKAPHDSVSTAAGSPLPDSDCDIEKDEVQTLIGEISRLAEADAAPNDPTGLGASGWRDISKPTAKVLYKAKSNPARDCVFMGMESQDQVPWLPLLEMEGSRITCGAIPTLWATPHWPLWFPFCESNVILKRFSPSSFICQVTLKVMFLSLDFILFVGIEDKLNSEEQCIEVLIKSPPAGSEDQEWMGITVPPKKGSLPRICVCYARNQVRPTGPNSVSVTAQCELEDVSGAPQWLKSFIFQQLAVRILPELVKFQRKIPGSPLDNFLNGSGDGCIDAEGLDYIRELNRSIEAFTARTATAAATSS
eukprot:TRINITY_DN91728_c0_g1_i1.p1 TRINITY_DN91728_c0_g1~~TRINITY_DN91728_c0_g1_i1.p1  ORF type:complete len:392 (+),score=74.38 TRINITY_DN91728_c0_g1_i1:34-1209(+)